MNIEKCICTSDYKYNTGSSILIFLKDVKYEYINAINPDYMHYIVYEKYHLPISHSNFNEYFSSIIDHRNDLIDKIIYR